MGRPWVAHAPVLQPAYQWPKLPSQMTFNELFAQHQARLRRVEDEAGVTYE
jgi:hypothetical protein